VDQWRIFSGAGNSELKSGIGAEGQGMRYVWLLTIFVLSAGYAAGQQSNEQAPGVGSPAAAAGAAAVAASPAALPPGTVQVYLPHSPVKPPRLLPPAEPLDFPKHCTDTSVGESELSLLIDTEGRARNIMFLRPSGTLADRFAIIIAGRDRFAPGTLNGKPVVVAEALQIKSEACIGLETDASGKMVPNWLLKSPPKQKLKKPKNAPQVAELAPLKKADEEITRTVRRPDFFGEGESAPVLLYSEYADYTPSQPGTEGACEVALVVDEHGLPQDLHVLKKLDPGLDRSALDAVEKYRYFPAIRGNKPVSAALAVRVEFAPPR